MKPEVLKGFVLIVVRELSPEMSISKEYSTKEGALVNSWGGYPPGTGVIFEGGRFYDEDGKRFAVVNENSIVAVTSQ